VKGSKPSWGVGIVIAVLISAATALLGVVTPQGAVSLALLLVGLWTFLSAFAIVAEEDRVYYAGWGVIVAGLSLSYFIPIQQALALIIIAIVALIVATVFFGRSVGRQAAKPTAPPPVPSN
jgi:hypothetical protein